MRKLLGRMLESVGMLDGARWVFRRGLGLIRDISWSLRRGGRVPGNSSPVPPPSLCFLAADSYDPGHYLASGRTGAESVTELLELAGRPVEDFRSVLDLGCGTCRILRHLREHIPGASLTGIDTDPVQVRWAGSNLPGIDFHINGPGERLPFGDSEFDLVLAIAVFPWLREADQILLMGEIRRILVPDGTLLLSLKGVNRRDEIPRRRLREFDGGEPVVIDPERSGSRYCLSYSPEEYVRRRLSAGFRIILHSPAGSRDTNQDAWVMARS